MTALRSLLFFCVLLLTANAFAAGLSGSLTGAWKGELMGQPLSLTLGANGQGMLDDAPIRYQVMGNTLVIDDDGEVNAYQFRQQGDTLVVTGADLPGPVTLRRGAAASAKRETRTAAAAKAGGAGGTRQELVGKWCKASTFLANNGGGSQRSACFELRADGSYVYGSESSMDASSSGMWGGTTSSGNDSGRWTATASSITAQSASGQSATYQLEKRNHPKNRDPMICLDGECYVTYWQKKPW
ncbi:MAG TPA: hypothetical protein VF050_03370 [Moraxellaceae bacterium]